MWPDALHWSDVVQHLQRTFVRLELTENGVAVNTGVVQGAPGEVHAGVGGKVVVLCIEAVLLGIFRELDDLVVLLVADLDRSLVAGVLVDPHIIGVHRAVTAAIWLDLAGKAKTQRICLLADTVEGQIHMADIRVFQINRLTAPHATTGRARRSNMNGDGVTLCCILHDLLS
ncbi:hypothetical protein D3C81_1233990 [compost metagenome]